MKTNLCLSHDKTFWPFHSWRQFSLMPDRGSRVVILPVTAFSDWGPEVPLDFEETLTLSLLTATLGEISAPERFLVLPPLRFNLGRKERIYFGFDPETVHAAIEDVVRSVARHDFRKVLFLNSNPANEDLVDCAGRDLRIALGIQPFCINLRGIGLEWNSEKGREYCLRTGRALSAGKVRDNEVDKLTGSLSGLLDEVHAFRQLPDSGRIPTREAFS